jgi:hypothetical protein
MIEHNYQFFFVGGTCGSFVKGIFYTYLHSVGYYKHLPPLRINPVTGDCHNNNLQHVHWIEQLNPTKKIILIDFDDDDKTTIIRMAFHKVVLANISSDPTILKTQWGISIDPNNLEQLEKTFIQNPNFLIFPDWKQQIKLITPALTIRFNNILFGDINGIISNFLQIDRLPGVDHFVEQYRKINQKYITDHTG